MSPFAGLTLLESRREPERYRARLQVAPESPFLVGHFPGHPVLPGIAHLALALDGARALTGREVTLSSLRGVRFRRAVRPGDTIDLAVSSSDAAGSFRFEVQLAGAVASSGAIEVTLGG